MDADMAGKTVAVTGVTSGIGSVIARRLAERGARILAVARDPGRTGDFVAGLPRAARGSHQAYVGDLSLVSEARRVGREIAGDIVRLDVLVNNAGGVFARREVTSEGLERTFALNHMAYFVMTGELLDRLKAAPQGRVVSTASRMHSGAKLDFDDLQAERGYSAIAAYGRSKLANILFTRELAHRLRKDGGRVTANAVHPGFVATELGDDDPGLLGKVFGLAKRFALTPEQGAETTLYVATSAEGGAVTGQYFEKRRIVSPAANAQDPATGERLWHISEALAAER